MAIDWSRKASSLDDFVREFGSVWEKDPEEELFHCAIFIGGPWDGKNVTPDAVGCAVRTGVYRAESIGSPSLWPIVDKKASSPVVTTDYRAYGYAVVEHGRGHTYWFLVDSSSVGKSEAERRAKRYLHWKARSSASSIDDPARLDAEHFAKLRKTKARAEDKSGLEENLRDPMFGCW